MPKLGIAPARREQICRAAASVIAEHGFAGATMRLVAERAGVSTGMLNHHFSNRMAMLEETLVFVSRRTQARVAATVDAAQPGEPRLRELIRSLTPTESEMIETWRVWIAVYGASVSSQRLRDVLGSRNALWYDILSHAVEGLVEPAAPGSPIPVVWELDAMINGLMIQATATTSSLDFHDVEESLVAAVKRYGARQVRHR